MVNRSEKRAKKKGLRQIFKMSDVDDAKFIFISSSFVGLCKPNKNGLKPESRLWHYSDRKVSVDKFCDSVKNEEI